MLVPALYTSTAGIQAASGFLDLTGNNVANADTVGFKSLAARFQDFPYFGLQPSASDPDGTLLGGGAALANTFGLFTQGPLTLTSEPLDLAIQGDGFFAVTFPDGTLGYTRAGNFNLDAAGQLVNDQGFRLAPAITVPAGTTDVTVGADGTVTATTPTGPVAVGTLTLTTFRNAPGLARVGGTTFVETAASGPGTVAAPGTGIAGTIQSGFLENSNVQVATELVNLIIAQRAFSVNTQAFTVTDRTIEATTALIT